MVHYLYATEEQKALANGARELLERELAPCLAEYEKKGEFPWHVYRSMAKAGYNGVGVSKRWGGMGTTFKTQCLVWEEMAQVDAGFSFTYALGTENIGQIETTAMPKEEKQMWVNKILNGETVCATALTEPNAGSDTKSILTEAVLDGNEWVINGTKCFITGGGLADAFIVSAYVDRSKGAKGIAQFFVERDRGVKTSRAEHKMGLRTSVTSEVIFEDVRVPMDHMVGSIFTMRPEEGKELMAEYSAGGNAAILNGLAIARICSMAHALGIAQRAMDEAVNFAKNNRINGIRQIDYQGTGFKLADMQTKIDAARALLYYSADALDAGIRVGTLSPSTKLFVSEMLMSVTSDAMDIAGDYAYLEEYPFEKLLRDSKIFSIFEGTNEINRLVAQRELAGKDPLMAKK